MKMDINIDVKDCRNSDNIKWELVVPTYVDNGVKKPCYIYDKVKGFITVNENSLYTKELGNFRGVTRSMPFFSKITPSNSEIIIKRFGSDNEELDTLQGNSFSCTYSENRFGECSKIEYTISHIGYEDCTDECENSLFTSRDTYLVDSEISLKKKTYSEIKLITINNKEQNDNIECLGKEYELDENSNLVVKDCEIGDVVTIVFTRDSEDYKKNYIITELVITNSERGNTTYTFDFNKNL